MKNAGFVLQTAHSIKAAQIMGHETVILICMKFPMYFLLENVLIQLKITIKMSSDVVVQRYCRKYVKDGRNVKEKQMK